MLYRDFAEAAAGYERTLRARFGPATVDADLARKTDKMRNDPFVFLRGSCFRWAEAAPALTGQLAGASLVGSVGDTHAGNFGLWRDARARLVWGVDDFDEAARLPWTFDLVRLAASVLIALPDSDAGDVAGAMVSGYRDGLDNPSATVIEDQPDRLWLRRAFAATNPDRRKFWHKLDRAAPQPNDTPPDLAAALATAAVGVDTIKLARRIAGTGSLGRPRFVASGQWQGGRIAFEAKGAMDSCFSGGRVRGLAQRLARGRYRAPEPAYVLTATHVLRRLAPDNRKLRFAELRPALGARLIAAMARDIAAIHAHEADVHAVRAELDRFGADVFADTACRVAQWTKAEWKAWR